MDHVIDLLHGKQTIIDEEDWPKIEGLTFYYHQASGYVYITKREIGRSVTLHSYLLPAPQGKQTDHKDGDPLNNRRRNLRVVTYQRNQINRKRPHKNSRTGIRGVGHYPHLNKKKPWYAQIMVDGRTKSLGYHRTKREAVEARREGELQFFGELCP